MLFRSGMVAPIGKTVLGGLSFGTLMTLFLMPAIYAIINKRSDERAIKAELRRQQIAKGLTRKKDRKAAAGNVVVPVVDAASAPDHGGTGNKSEGE